MGFGDGIDRRWLGRFGKVVGRVIFRVGFWFWWVLNFGFSLIRVWEGFEVWD